MYVLFGRRLVGFGSALLVILVVRLIVGPEVFADPTFRGVMAALVLAYVLAYAFAPMLFRLGKRLRRRGGSAPTEPNLPPPGPAGGPPGWYPDPSGAQAQRYWDGRQWTASIRSSAL